MLQYFEQYHQKELSLHEIHVLFSEAKLLYWSYLLNLPPATYTKDGKRLKQNFVKYVSKRYYGLFFMLQSND